MPQPSIAEETEERPLDPAVEKVRRKLVKFVAVNLGLLFLALMAVVAAVVYKSREDTKVEPFATDAGIPRTDAGGIVQGTIVLPDGARMISQTLAGARILVDAELAGGERTLFLYDIAEDRIVGRFAVTAK